MKAVDIPTFQKAIASGARIFDTRSRPVAPLTGMERLTLEQVQAGGLPDVAFDEAIYLICDHGQISEIVGLYLEAAGFSRVYNVSGGLEAWQAFGEDSN